MHKLYLRTRRRVLRDYASLSEARWSQGTYGCIEDHWCSRIDRSRSRTRLLTLIDCQGTPPTF